MIDLTSVYWTLLARMSVAMLFPMALYFTGFFTEGEIEFALRVFRQGMRMAGAQWMRIR